MKRREFNRLALGAGVSPLLASRAFAQGPEQSKAAPAEASPNKINVVIKNTPRTPHTPRHKHVRLRHRHMGIGAW